MEEPPSAASSPARDAAPCGPSSPPIVRLSDEEVPICDAADCSCRGDAVAQPSSLLARMQSRATHALSSAVSGVHTRLVGCSSVYAHLFGRVRALPITEFYLYMYRVDPTLLIKTLAVNYGLPVAMEAMPWYLSRRKISRLLRESRNSITHRLVANESFSDSAIGSFVLFSLVYALVQTVEQILRLRVMMENRLLIRRLVLERILYSELGSLQARYFAVFGESVRTDQLEQIVFNDISETLNLFNTTLPSLMRGAYTLVGSAHDLWLNRDAFDVLAILRPSLVGLTSECVNFVREKYLLDAQTLQQQRNASAASRVVTNIVDGLAEIQTNNLQQFQLRMLDAVSGEELQNQQGTTTFVSNIYRQVSNRSVFDFASEVYVVRMVMNRRKINHETYRQVQNDIDYVTRLFGRLWSQARDAHRVYETQERVIEILNLPTFIQEASMLKRDAPPQRVCPKLAAPYPPAETEETIIESQPDTTQEAASIDDASFVRPSSPDVTVGDVSTAAQLSTSAFQFESLHFRRCAFRYQSHLPLALNLHPRVPGEATTEEDDDSSDEDESHEESPCVGSTRPEDLLREMSTVLAHRRLPTSIMRSMPTSSFDNRSDAQFGVRPRSSSHAHSSVMADIMQSEEAADDADDDTDANLTDDGGDAEDDDYIRALDEFVQQKELANSLIEFASAAVPSAPPSPPAASQLRLNRAESIPSSVPSPLMSPSPPCTACEPGTLLFERGKSYALIGENRSGKSTLMQLLCKLYQPAAADCDIRLNGADFTSLPRVLLRERISYVAQRPFIFPGTIEENIRIGNTTATAAEVERAAEMAGIFTMEQPKSATAANNTATSSYAGRSLVDRTGMQIVAKPWEQNRLKSVLLAVGGWMQRQWMRVHGVEPDDCDPLEEEEDDEEEAEAESQQSSHPCPPAEDAAAAPSPAPVAIHPTLLLETGERGSNLSGGFAQSVALARVFLRKEAQIIILDEAMGQMDSLKKRELIFPRLFEFVAAHNMTLILISHDVPLVCKLVDTVYVMRHGECVQSGSHRQLMQQKGGAYARLVGEQDGREDTPREDEEETR